VAQTDREVEVRWKPFLLRHGVPDEGVPKSGTPETRVPPRMKAAGAAVGVDFTGKCDRYPNTLSHHALLKYAAEVAPAKQNTLQEVLFRHYFTDGLYPAGANLALAATEAGLDGEAARAYAEDDANRSEVECEARANAAMGITGVPYFFINGEPAGSGAQPPEAFLRMFEAA